MQFSSEKLTIEAPAKVNLHLAVLDRRPDGFHNLESIFVAVDFFDTLHFEPLESRNLADIIINWSGKTSIENIPLEKNIIFKALSLFRTKTGFCHGLKIKVDKRIPLGSGLGGGSSNAAATLLALNKMSGFPLNRDELLEMAALLGSDVPFFIHETAAARVTGRGENIEHLDAPALFFVLVNPGFPSDTAAAFRLLDVTRKDFTQRHIRTRGSGTELKKMTDTILNAPLRLCASNFEKYFNDFLPVFDEPEKSVYSEIISQLHGLGAEFASLSGSGSTCFGVFKERAHAQKAAADLRANWDFVECCGVKIY